MGLLITIFVGFLVGLLARAFKPGVDNLGIIMTTLLGIGGALLGAYLGQAFGWYMVGEPAGFIVSLVCSILILYVVEAFAGKRHRTI